MLSVLHLNCSALGRPPDLHPARCPRPPFCNGQAGAVDSAELAMYAALLMDSNNSEMIEFLMAGMWILLRNGDNRKVGDLGGGGAEAFGDRLKAKRCALFHGGAEGRLRTRCMTLRVSRWARFLQCSCMLMQAAAQLPTTRPASCQLSSFPLFAGAGHLVQPLARQRARQEHDEQAQRRNHAARDQRRGACGRKLVVGVEG